jgi:hypothetical protein
VLVATAVNGLSLFRLWMKVFLGPSRPGAEVPARELSVREWAPVLLLVVVLLAQGLMPSLALRARAVAPASDAAPSPSPTAARETP